MFEQESYDKATVQAASQPGELFNKYEIRTWEFSPVIYKILAASAVVHLAFLAFISQTNVLTARGCDSPWVGRVCQVVDMTYVGAMLFGTDREYADVEYERTQLEEGDEVTFIDVTNSAPLSYPEGYFQIANPVQFQMLQQAALNPTMPGDVMVPGYQPPGFSSVPSYENDLLKQPAKPPTANPNAFLDDSNDTVAKVNGGSSFPRRKGRGGRVRQPLNNNANTAVPDPGISANTNANTQQVTPVNPAATPTDEATADENGIFINKRPLKDKAKETVGEVDRQKVKLDSAFKVIITGTLGLAKDGKTVVLKDPKPVPVDPKMPNDPALMKLAQEWVLAVGDAGWFGYLDVLDVDKKIKTKRVVITIEQNDADFIANVRSELPTENIAKQAASGLNAFIFGGRLRAQLGGREDELSFLESAKTSYEVNNLVLNVQMPKSKVQELIQRKLAEAKAENQPSSTALISGKSATASK